MRTADVSDTPTTSIIYNQTLPNTRIMGHRKNVAAKKVNFTVSPILLKKFDDAWPSFQTTRSQALSEAIRLYFEEYTPGKED